VTLDDSHKNAPSHLVTTNSIPRNVNLNPHLFAIGEVGNIQEIFIDAKRDIEIKKLHQIMPNYKITCIFSSPKAI